MSAGGAYLLHGVRLGVLATGDGERAAAGVHSRLAGLPLDGGGPCDVTFEIAAAAAHAFDRPAAGRPVYDPPLGEVIYDDAADQLYIGYGPRLRVLCDPGRGRARASAAGMEEEDLWSLSHPLFTLPLVELLKRRGLYGLHAGGVCRDGRALLLPGTSGSGKSTLTLALARAGFGFLGDDTLFLAAPAGGGAAAPRLPRRVRSHRADARLLPRARRRCSATRRGRGGASGRSGPSGPTGRRWSGSARRRCWSSPGWRACRRAAHPLEPGRGAASSSPPTSC